MSASKSSKLTGTALLAALVIVFDYALKFSGLKIPFPWMPTLKFDFTGIPIALSLFMYGPVSALTTSLVAFVGILARSGDVIGASMKFAAEFSTVLGLGLGVRAAERLTPLVQKGAGLALGVAFRVVAMSVANILVLPLYGYPDARRLRHAPPHSRLQRRLWCYHHPPRCYTTRGDKAQVPRSPSLVAGFIHPKGN